MLRADGSVGALAPGGPLLGVVPDAAFQASRMDLAPGEALVLYTDGATEAQDAAGAELDVDGLDRILAGTPRRALALVDAVVEAVDAWAAGGAAEDDDLTVVAVCRAT